MENDKKTKEQIIEELARNKVVETMISNVGKGKVTHSEDLAQDIYYELMLKDGELLKKLYESGEINYYISRIVTNNVWSTNSRYHYKYERFDEKITSIEGIDLPNEE